MAAPGPHPAPTGRWGHSRTWRTPPHTPTSHLSSQNRGFACSILWSPVSLTPECCGPLGLWVGETEAGGSCSVG